MAKDKKPPVTNNTYTGLMGIAILSILITLIFVCIRANALFDGAIFTIADI